MYRSLIWQNKHGPCGYLQIIHIWKSFIAFLGLALCFLAIFLKQYIEDITRGREDMKFMFWWQEQYLTSERSERVRCCSCHEKVKFTSSSQRVMFFLLYGETNSTKAPTSFPGSSLYLEKVPWLRLVTCLLDFSRFQRCDRREGLEI